MFRFLISRAFFINLLIAGVLIGGLMWYSLKFLHDYTKHGEIISVPDLTGFVVEDIEGYLEERNLRYEVRDIIYNANKPRGSVLDQDPKPDSWVKENRRIYLIVNATETPKVPMPDLIDETFRRASSILEIRGFKLGKLEIVEEMGNKVTGFKYQGKEIKAGYKVPKGATIDLIMAGGSSLTKIEAPNIIGMVLEEAIMTLKESSLNNANPGWDDNVITTSDTLNARVYKQDPVHGGELISRGGYVHFWMTMDGARITSDSMATRTPDSTLVDKTR